MKSPSCAPRCIVALLFCAAPRRAAAAPPFAFASYPLFLAPAIEPNVMVILDNSESMDATMAGKIISGRRSDYARQYRARRHPQHC